MKLRIHLLAAALAAVLTGCGPGTGGTGTGSSLVEFGATAANVCTSSFAAALACGTEVIVSPTQPAPSGTSAVGFVDRTVNATLTVGFDGNRVQLDARCAGLSFDGEWGQTATGVLRYWGTLGLAGGPQQGSLEVALPPAAPGTLLLTLRDGTGRVVLGPLTVVRGSSATAGSC